MTSVTHDSVQIYPLMGGNHLPQAGGLPQTWVYPKLCDSPAIVTTPNNVPGLLYSSQYQNGDFQEEFTGAVATYDNSGAALWSFADECLFNGSFAANQNDYRENASGLQKQTNPDYYPEKRHYGARMPGFSTVANVPAPTQPIYTTDRRWLASLFDNTRVF